MRLPLSLSLSPSEYLPLDPQALFLPLSSLLQYLALGTGLETILSFQGGGAVEGVGVGGRLAPFRDVELRVCIRHVLVVPVSIQHRHHRQEHLEQQLPQA